MLCDALDEVGSNARGVRVGSWVAGFGSSTWGLRTYRAGFADCTPHLVASDDTSSLISCAVFNDSQEIRAACSGAVR